MLRISFLLLTAAVIAASIFSAGCGGASMNTSEYRNLDGVEPDFENPPWYDLYGEDPAAANKKYRKKVLQLDVMVDEFEELPAGIRIQGTTGESDRYRIVCMYPSAASATMQDARPEDRIIVKGLFDRIENAGNTYAIFLKNCVSVR